MAERRIRALLKDIRSKRNLQRVRKSVGQGVLSFRRKRPGAMLNRLNHADLSSEDSLLRNPVAVRRSPVVDLLLVR
jgi:hypothetical protein